MKKLIALLVLAATIMACGTLEDITGQTIIEGEGPTTSIEPEASGFTQVEVRVPMQVNVTLGDTESVTIEGYANLIDALTVSVEDDTLVIEKPDDVQFTNVDLAATITVTSITDLIIFSAAEVNLPELSESLNIEVNGAAQINIPLIEADSLTAVVNGAGELTISNGELDTLNVTLNGTGQLNAGDVQAQSVAIDVNGGGTATVWAVNALDVSVAGGADIDYYGDPDVTENVTGGADITSLGEK